MSNKKNFKEVVVLQNTRTKATTTIPKFYWEQAEKAENGNPYRKNFWHKIDPSKAGYVKVQKEETETVVGGFSEGETEETREDTD